MEIVQEILVFITFFLALGYMFTKFIYKPKFLYGTDQKNTKSCGVECGSCH